MTFRKTITLLLFPLIMSAQNEQVCEVNQGDFTTIVNGDVTGTLISANVIRINNIHCEGNCYFLKGNELLIIQDRGNTTLKNGSLQASPRIETLALAKQITSEIPYAQSICFRELVEESIRQNNFRTYRNESSTTRAIAVPINRQQLEEYGLQLVYAPSNGIIRVKRRGQYYYRQAKDDSCISIDSFAKGCERFAYATDFNNGIAVVGKKAPVMRYWIINTKGEKISQEYYKVNLDKFKQYGFIEFTTKNDNSEIYNRKGKLITAKDWPANGIVMEINEQYKIVAISPKSYQIFNSNGTTTVATYELIEAVDEQKELFRVKTKGGHYGYINKAGNLLVDTNYLYLGIIDSIWNVTFAQPSIDSIGLLYRDGSTKMYSNLLKDTISKFNSSFYTGFDSTTGVAFLSQHSKYNSVDNNKGFPFGAIDGLLVDDIIVFMDTTKRVSSKIHYIPISNKIVTKITFEFSEPLLGPVTVDFFVNNGRRSSSFFEKIIYTDPKICYGKVFDKMWWQFHFPLKSTSTNDKNIFENISFAFNKGYDSNNSIKFKDLYIVRQGNMDRLVQTRNQEVQFLSKKIQKIVPFNSNLTYTSYGEGTSSFITTDGHESRRFPFEVQELKFTNYHNYAYVKQNNKLGLFDIDNYEFVIQPVLDLITEGPTSKSITIRYQDNVLTIEDQGGFTPALLDGDPEVYKQLQMN